MAHSSPLIGDGAGVVKSGAGAGKDGGAMTKVGDEDAKHDNQGVEADASQGNALGTTVFAALQAQWAAGIVKEGDADAYADDVAGAEVRLIKKDERPNDGGVAADQHLLTARTYPGGRPLRHGRSTMCEGRGDGLPHGAMADEEPAPDGGAEPLTGR
eukprot:gene14479-30382_t